MSIKSIIAGLLITLPCLAEDLMVERMQGVVNEVRELRERYEDSVHKNEACLSTLKEQEVLLQKKGLTPCVKKKQIEELALENSKLNEALEAAKIQDKKYKKLQDDFQSIKKEKDRLSASAEILVEKNHSLLVQVNNFKRSSPETKDSQSIELLQEKEKLLQELNVRKHKIDELKQKLETCKSSPKRSVEKVKVSKKVCVDDNPFPVLMKKETKTEPKSPFPKKSSPGVFRIKGESPIYNAPDGDVLEVWEDRRSFTSTISQDDWIKITGFFINKRWTKAKNEMWVQKVNTVKR